MVVQPCAKGVQILVNWHKVNWHKVQIHGVSLSTKRDFEKIHPTNLNPQLKVNQMQYVVVEYPGVIFNSQPNRKRI